MYFTDIVKDHKHLKTTIAQIEATKNRIRNNERQNIPLPEITLRHPFTLENASYSSAPLEKENDIGIKLVAFVKGIESGEIRGDDILTSWESLVVEMDHSFFNTKEESALNRITEALQKIASSKTPAKAVDLSIIKQNIQKVLIPALIQDQGLAGATASEIGGISEIQSGLSSDIIEQSNVEPNTEPDMFEDTIEPEEFEDSKEEEGRPTSVHSAIGTILLDLNQNMDIGDKAKSIQEQLDKIHKIMIERQKSNQRIKISNNSKNLATLIVFNSLFDLGFHFFKSSKDDEMNAKIQSAVDKVTEYRGTQNHSRFIISIWNINQDYDNSEAGLIADLRQINSSQAAGSGMKGGNITISNKKNTEVIYNTKFLSKRADDILAAIKLGNRSRQMLNELDDIMQVLVNRKAISSENRGKILNQLHGFVTKK